MELPA
ncbi:Protein of unknown function [Lactobacillus helveticus CIRM-BIA 953]